MRKSMVKFKEGECPIIDDFPRNAMRIIVAQLRFFAILDRGPQKIASATSQFTKASNPLMWKG